MSTVLWFYHGSIIDESAEENVLKNEKNENRYKTKKGPPLREGPNFSAKHTEII